MRVRSLMKEYFDRGIADEQLIPDDVELLRPAAAELGLEQLESPARLRKSYVFDDPRKAVAFVNDLVDHEVATGHHATISLRESQVTVEVRTEATDSITDLDHEYIEYADAVQSDFKGDWNTEEELQNEAVRTIRNQRLLGIGWR